MSKETEKKIQLDFNEVEEILTKCERLFGTKVLPFIQTDEYFDRTDGIFQNKDYTVRLRTDDLSDGKLYKIAVKGPRIFFSENKGYTRIDIEFSALSYEEFQTEIKRKDLICVAKLEKERWKYKKDLVKVTIDKYPFIGYFLEVEAPNSEQISKYVELLEITQKESITQNSTELLEEKLKELRLPIRPNLIATFELEKDFYNNN